MRIQRKKTSNLNTFQFTHHVVIALWIALTVFLSIALPGRGISGDRLTALNEDGATDPIPFSSESNDAAWRLGFKFASGAYLLELEHDNPSIRKEQDRLIEQVRKRNTSPYIPDKVALFPFHRATELKGLQIINPLKWWVFDLKGFAQQVSFTRLAAYMTEAANSGIWYMGSSSLRERDWIFLRAAPFTDSNFVFAIAGTRSEIPKVRLPLTDYSRDLSLLPKGAKDLIDVPVIRARLGKEHARFKESVRLINGNSIRGIVREGKSDIIWLLQWRTEHMSDYEENVWGLFKIAKERFEPLYISEPFDSLKLYDKLYRVYLFAAVDLDGDGVDEIVVKVCQYEGSNFQVLSLKNGKFSKVYTSFYHGL